MAKKNPSAWFPDPYIAMIRWRKVDKWAEARAVSNPYFDAWAEAHGWQVETMKKRAERAQREHLSAQRRLKRVLDMKEPAAISPDRGAR